MESTFQTSAAFHITTPTTTALAVGDRKPERRSRSPSYSSSSQALRPDEDWTKISDLAERRRIQNRIAQRNYRKKLKRRLEELEKRAGGSPPSDSNSPPPLQTSPVLSSDTLPDSDDGKLEKESIVDPILVQSSYPPFTYSQPSKPSESSLDLYPQGSPVPRQLIQPPSPLLQGYLKPNMMKPTGFSGDQQWSYCMGWAGLLGQDIPSSTLPDGSIPLTADYYDPAILIPDSNNNAAVVGQMDAGSLDGSFYDTALSSPSLSSLSQDMAAPPPQQQQQYMDALAFPQMRDRLLQLISSGQADEDEIYREYGAKLQQQLSNHGSMSSVGLSDDDADGVVDMDTFVKPENVDGEMFQWSSNYWQDNRGGREAVLLQ